MVLKHIKNKKPYLKLFKSKIKLDGEWKECVIYLCLYFNREGMIWVRLVDDFKNSFK